MKNGVKKNIIYNFTYQILNLILPFITAPYLSRTIGAEGVGVYSFSQSVAMYFTYLTLLGLTNYGNRTIAAVQNDKDKRSKLFFEIFALQVIMFVLSLVLYGVYIVFFSVNHLAAVIMIAWVVSAVFDINWFFFGMEQFKLTVIRNTIIKVASVVCIFAFVRSKDDVYIYIVIMAVSTLISQLCLWPYMKRFVHFVKPTWSGIAGHIKPNLKLFIPVIAASVYNMMDKIMIGYMSNMKEVGFYENAEKIIKMIQSLIVAVGTVMLPRMTALFSQSKNKQGSKYFDTFMEVVLIYVCGAIFGILAISNEFCTFYFGPGFEKTAYLLNILVVTVLFFGAGNVLRTQLLIPLKKDGIYIKSSVLGAVLNLVVNWILIPKFGSVGASLATILAEVVVCAYQFISVRKEVPVGKYIAQTLIYVGCGGVMYLFLWYLPHTGNGILSLLKQVVLGCAVYLVLVAIVIVIKRKLQTIFACKREKV